MGLLWHNHTHDHTVKAEHLRAPHTPARHIATGRMRTWGPAAAGQLWIGSRTKLLGTYFDQLDLSKYKNYSSILCFSLTSI